MNTAEHMTLAKPAAWCTSGSPGGATYAVSNSIAFAREINAAALGRGSGGDSADWAPTVAKCCVGASVTTNANKNAVNNARIRYILLLSSAFAERCERTAGGHVNGGVEWMGAGRK